ncbi:MAG: OmpA family protein [Myxococcota bacterium]
MTATYAARRLTLLAVFVTAPLAHATHDAFGKGFDLFPVKQTTAMDSGVGLEGATFRGPKSFRFAAMFDMGVGMLALKLGQEKLGDLVPFRTDLHLFGSYQLLPKLELGAHLPLTLAQVNDFDLLAQQGFRTAGPSALGVGSLRVLPRVSILDPAKALFGLAAVAEVRLPAPSAQSFIGDAGFVFAPRLAAERAFGPVRVLANMGYRLRPYHAQFINLFIGNEFTAGAGAIVDLPSFSRFTEVQFVGETHLVTPTERPFTFDQADSLKTPWELLLGVRGKVRGNWGAEVTLGRGLGTTTGYGREAFRLLAGVRYDFTFDDRDGDGIADHVDACPDVPEDKDGFEDSDGCPEPDNDKDGVNDNEDGCPMDPGPGELEGCPDRDGDGVPDIVDKCPDEPGPVENEGCPVPEEPEVELESERIRVRGQIQFETAQATILPQSFKMLDDVYKVLADNPEVGPVLVEGHTDDRGTRPYNLDLSKRRAQAVVNYLLNKGIAKNRLKSAGFGFDKPIADNATPLGRAKNRRTEFRLVSEEEAVKEEGEKKPEPGAK